ncbi:DUF6943 family protein [Winogradskyella marincola]|uniref:Type I restriction modification DNA specificity domain-containing protein n=1 Tax=Winogradskyella marincola TaxID=3037795 RepID=A0ABT6FYS3_9FLAO|nr:hypothetical protein [Winogradskyella sp. YYF002]MDG4714827.1 hypothetical protein [Winogradskyella sp. YYF002]
MSYFEMKTHQIGRTYSNPHFFILNKGLNSGKPLSNPCPNCFVVITKTETEKNTLFHLSMMLQIGGFYAYYLKGSVIQFISVDDCRNTLKNGLRLIENTDFEFKKSIEIVSGINKKQQELKQTIIKLENLKLSFTNTLFNLSRK